MILYLQAGKYDSGYKTKYNIKLFIAKKAYPRQHLNKQWEKVGLEEKAGERKKSKDGVLSCFTNGLCMTKKKKHTMKNK